MEHLINLMSRAARTSSEEVRCFFRAWLTNPLRVGAVMPSGTALADAITCEISVAASPVIELGAGTGVFSRALLARGVPEEQLTLIENCADFACLLQLRFPRARTLRMDAAELKNIELFDGAGAGAIVSGLPLLSMSPRRVISILEGAFRHLRPGGALYQFTYGPRCPISHALLHRLGLRANRIGGVLANLPPASVYRIRRRRVRRVLGRVALDPCSSLESPREPVQLPVERHVEGLRVHTLATRADRNRVAAVPEASRRPPYIGQPESAGCACMADVALFTL